MSRGGAKRRLRIRRKRKGEDSAADKAADFAGESPEVVAEFGCCLIETVGGLSILIGLLVVPYYFLVA